MPLVFIYAFNFHIRFPICLTKYAFNFHICSLICLTKYASLVLIFALLYGNHHIEFRLVKWSGTARGERAATSLLPGVSSNNNTNLRVSCLFLFPSACLTRVLLGIPFVRSNKYSGRHAWIRLI